MNEIDVKTLAAKYGGFSFAGGIRLTPEQLNHTKLGEILGQTQCVRQCNK